MKYDNKKCLHSNTSIITKEETYSVKGRDIKIIANVRVCDECKKELFDAELDNENLKRVYDTYRKEAGLLTSEDIKSIRNNLGISQETLDNLILANPGSTKRYERSGIQSNIFDAFLRLTKDPNAVKILANLPYSNLSGHEKEFLLNQR